MRISCSFNLIRPRASMDNGLENTFFEGIHRFKISHVEYGPTE